MTNHAEVIAPMVTFMGLIINRCILNRQRVPQHREDWIKCCSCWRTSSAISVNLIELGRRRRYSWRNLIAAQETSTPHPTF